MLINTITFYQNLKNNRTKKASKYRCSTLNGDPGEIRTPDLLLRRQLLYPTELQGH